MGRGGGQVALSYRTSRTSLTAQIGGAPRQGCLLRSPGVEARSAEDPGSPDIRLIYTTPTGCRSLQVAPTVDIYLYLDLSSQTSTYYGLSERYLFHSILSPNILNEAPTEAVDPKDPTCPPAVYRSLLQGLEGEASYCQWGARPHPPAVFRW